MTQNFFAVRVSQPRSKTPPSFPSSIACSCTRPAVGLGLNSSQITREYTYFRKNRVQIRKSRKAGSGTSAGVEVYTAPGMKAHFRLAFD